jgi:hypothetical protein
VTPQRRKDAELLERAQPGGVSNGEFVHNKVLRYSARIEELRKDFGLDIACERRSGSTYIYRLRKDVDGGGSSPAALLPGGKAPAPSTIACRDWDGEWKDIPTPEWALAGEGQ